MPIVIAPGYTAQDIVVPITADLTPEPQEFFYATITDANVYVTDSQGICTINDNDKSATIDIDTDSNNDTFITEADEPIEVNSPGRYVRNNDDDDDKDHEVDGAGLDFVPNEDDLAKATLSLNTENYTPAELAASTVRLTITEGAENISIWESIKVTHLGTIYDRPANDYLHEIYIEGIANGTAMIDAVFLDPQGNDLSRDRIRVTVVQVNIDIGHGQNDPVTPTYVSDLDEYWIGAVTAANLNDTDGDQGPLGVNDWNDSIVQSVLTTAQGVFSAGATVLPVGSLEGLRVGDTIAIGYNGATPNLPYEFRNITAVDPIAYTIEVDGGLTNSYIAPSITNLGRNEVDLMPLRIQAPSYIDPNVQNMTLTVAGGARIWLTPAKGIPLPLDANGEAAIPANVGSGLTLWVEAPPSESLRDISVKLSYLGVEDVVRATGVWADVNVFSGNLDKSAVLALLPEVNTELVHGPVKGQLLIYGGTGLRPITNLSGVSNLILIGFTIGPTGAANMTDYNGQKLVSFDATRKLAAAAWYIDRDTTTWIADSAFSHLAPLRTEEPNDDGLPDFDESSRADVNGYYYVADAPGLTSSIATRDDYALRFSVEEWLRMSIGPVKQSGNEVLGSRVSGIVKWHVVHTVTRDGDYYVRTTGGTSPEPYINDVSQGAIYVGVGDSAPPTGA